VAKTSTKKQKIPRLKHANFPPPKRFSQEKISEICEDLRISDRHTTELKSYLDYLVDHVNEWMSQEKAVDRRSDRARIINMREYIAAAQYELTKAKGLGVDGRLAVRSIAERLADIVSGNWLRYHFSGHAPSRPMRSIRQSPREPGRDETYPNYQFIRHRAPKVLQGLLQDLKSALASALTLLDSDPRARGGPHPLTYRMNVILNLANIWHQIGKTPVGTPGSDFAIFCELVFKAMGWPTDGLGSAIPDAIKDFRNRQKNTARLSK
jgi:hypothetical protein